tara:strand:- start:613 stop:1455 length:843 start_codon:yes stop_codon:yes gene_type:complete
VEINKIYCIDCLEGLKHLDNNSIHLLITSPPYNIGKDYELYKDDLPYEQYIKWLTNVFKESYRVIVEGGRVCINVGYIYTSENANTHAIKTNVRQMLPTYADLIVNLRNIGFTFQEHIIWDKIGNSAGDKIIFGSYPYPVDVYARQGTEHILIFKKGKSRVDIQEKRKNINNKIPKKEYFEYVQPIWDFRGQNMDKHCAPFPIELPLRLIKIYSFEGDTILDIFMGSGTTAWASKQLHRNYIGFELNQKWVNLSNSKLSQEILSDKEPEMPYHQMLADRG